ncbi:MAG: hypothetical protein JNK78_20120 [Planctomycetes bacterium]|nr:hypothetical protein [Planctomycetota bacterium]
MEVTPAAAVLAFVRRTFVGAFVAGTARAVLAIALVAASVPIAVRIAGGHLAPTVWWLLAAVPALGHGVWCARRERVSAATAALHLDRRLGLRGLLLCANEGIELDPAFRGEVRDRLLDLPAVLPRLQWKRILPWPLAALLLFAGVASVPPPAPPGAPLHRTAVAAELERLAEKLRSVLERGLVPEEQKQDLERRVEELKQRLADGDVPDWRDLDQLDQRVDREALLQAAAADRRDGDPAAGRAPTKSELTPEKVAAAAAALDAAGLLDALPPDARAMLEAMRGEKGFDPSALGIDPAAMQKLAEAMAQAKATGRFDPAQLDAALSPEQLADLQAVLDSHPGALPGSAGGPGVAMEGEGSPGDLPGRGAPTRGPGHAALQMTEDAAGGAADVLPLPPGAATPSEWVPVGARVAEPVVDPARNDARGSAGAEGTGGASWQLQLAPRHRAVVRRFFGDAAPPTGNERTGKERR